MLTVRWRLRGPQPWWRGSVRGMGGQGTRGSGRHQGQETAVWNRSPSGGQALRGAAGPSAAAGLGRAGEAGGLGGWEVGSWGGWGVGWGLGRAGRVGRLGDWGGGEAGGSGGGEGGWAGGGLGRVGEGGRLGWGGLGRAGEGGEACGVGASASSRLPPSGLPTPHCTVGALPVGPPGKCPSQVGGVA